ncbi:ABC transporter permease [Ectobacillus ponti]|uniref:ABC transporter permease n=1 Tax=Ectobacillus ponti TaxID=2961894 RepID=A0AA41X9W4_9BACI|nr:ABC transporter permease [Ectobacillus ponti]MCP8969394.1 ABC transporter permease [Ectobacillus ponti]
MRTAALIKRIWRQIGRDKRTLALLFLAPLLVLTLMHFLFNSSAVDPKLGVVGADSALVEKLKAADLDVTTYNTEKSSNDILKEEKLDGLLKIENGKTELTLYNTDPTKSKQLQMKTQQILAAYMQQVQAAKMKQAVPQPPQMGVEYVYGNKDTSFFDVFSPILVGFFVFFFVFLISGIGLLRERVTGTLERLLSTPVRRWEIVAGYLIGYGALAVLQTTIVVLYAVNVLGIILVGSIWSVIAINLLLALVALSLGILLSAFAASEFQMIQFIPLVIIPQVFFTGIFPLEGMPVWLQAIAKIMPMYYGAEALKDVMYKGMGLADVSGNLLVLAGFALLFMILNIVALKKYRKL